MKKTLHAVISLLCVVLALGVAALIYLEIDSRNGGIEDSTPSAGNTAPASGDTTGTTSPEGSAVPDETTGPGSPEETTQGATMPTFQTEDPDAEVTPEITFPDEEPQQTQPTSGTQATSGVDTDDNATPEIEI